MTQPTPQNPEKPSTKAQMIAWVSQSLLKPPFPCSPRQSLLNNKQPKQPAYYDGRYYKSLLWKEYQNWHSLEPDLREALINTWHSDARIEGISTLGGWNGLHWLGWIDFDLQHFESPEQLSNAIDNWTWSYYVLRQAPQYKTPSGGYRFLVAFEKEPENFGANNGFTFIEGSSRKLGELLTKNGGHTLLPPSIGTSGQAYEWVVWAEYPPVFESPEAIGLYPLTANSPTIRREETSNRRTVNQSNGNSHHRVSGEVPLYQFLTLDDRALIDAGSANGSRNTSGAKLARNLIGTAARLDYLGIRYSGDPYQLFLDYCHRCRSGDGWQEREWEQLWKSAQKDNPTATLTDDALSNCAQAWPKRQRRQELSMRSRPSPDSVAQPCQPPAGKAVNHSASTPVAPSSLHQKALQLEALGLADSVLTAQINKLSSETGANPLELRKLVSEIESERDLSDSLKDSSSQFSKLVIFRDQTIDLSRILPPTLASSLLTKATSSRVDPVRILQTLLPMAATMVGAKARVIVKEGSSDYDHWYEYLIFWTADISPPSSGKSDVQRAIAAPIEYLQRQENERLSQAEAELELVEEQWKALSKEEKKKLFDSEQNPKVFKKNHCKPRKWLFAQVTQQALERRLSEQPPQSASCWLKDELSGLYDALDQFTGGKGDARQWLLSAWSKPLWGSVDRVSLADSFYFQGQVLNITGGIQPKVAERIFQTASDPDGLLSRMLPAVSKLPSDFEVWSETKVDVFHILSSHFKRLASVGELDASFSESAKKLYVGYWQQLRRGYRFNEVDNPAMAYFLGKQASYVPRYALLLHLMDWAEGEGELGTITRDQMERAIELSQFYCGQFRLLQARSTEGNNDQPLEGLLLEIWQRCQANGSINTRQVCNSFKRKKFEGRKIKGAVALEMLKAISNAGMGRLDGKTLYSNHAPSSVSNVSSSLQPGYKVKPSQSNGSSHLSPTYPENPLFEKDECSPNNYNLEHELELAKKENIRVSGDAGDKPVENSQDNGLSMSPTWIQLGDTGGDSQQLSPVENKSASSRQIAETADQSANKPTELTQLPTQVGSTVKIHWAGSIRDGEIATVKSIDPERKMATVWLHKESIRRDLRLVEIPISKESEMEFYLELIE